MNHCTKQKFRPQQIKVIILCYVSGVMHYSFLESYQRIITDVYFYQSDEMRNQLRSIQTALMRSLAASWKCSSTFYQHGTAESQLLGIQDFATSTTFFRSVTTTFASIFVQTKLHLSAKQMHILYSNISCHQTLYNFIVTDKLLSRLQKYVVVQRSYFNWFKHCLNTLKQA